MLIAVSTVNGSVGKSMKYQLNVLMISISLIFELTNLIQSSVPHQVPFGFKICHLLKRNNFLVDRHATETASKHAVEPATSAKQTLT
jgi:hypothetical protein